MPGSLENFKFRNLQPTDLPFLKEMFYLSLFVPPGNEPYPRDIIEKPGLAKYYQEWGRASDLGFLVSNFNEPIGAVWSRFFTETEKGYAFVNEQTPEVGIALKQGYRNRGLGTALLSKLLEELAWRGVPAVSLSVDNRNPAIHLYRRLGFKLLREEGTAIIMVKKLE